ncbi:uncharacterized protein GGS22DRAFT_41591 [Annulohypoxylon maeteangense]|uniref:uncharacterized protein n=1 Tax=Annulohypoxylon maeteangense TaxID=1927788 RepID=UPI0020074E34|nr:uncharacterized protein GGS22DRAFT_41591 [Annulohypoxylon maeteangense]KAI0882833.1 hypothetical protein GGS22DRAFT_41591 [Annulohypoxylon maeteangense]
MWWFLEPHVMQLCHPSRRTHPHCLPLREYSRLTRNPSQFLGQDEMPSSNYRYMHQRMQYITPLLPPNWMAVVKSFWKAKDAATICQRMTVPKTELHETWVDEGADGFKMGKPVEMTVEAKGSIGFSGFCRWALGDQSYQHNNGHTGTIEFRSMESTLDPVLILNWLAVVTRLYDFARRGNTADILGILEKATMPDSKYDGFQLLEDLGLPTQAEYFGAKANTHTEEIVERLDTLFVPVLPK